MPVKCTRFVVAIDFGIARSGFAYAASHNPDEIWYNLRWPEQMVPEPKTPTVLLADSEGRIVNQGWPAMRQLADLGPNASYTLIDLFKMTLYRSDSPGGSPRTKRGNRYFDTICLIVHYLRWMRTLAIERITECLTAAWDEKEVRWCLSVPAIWSSEAKGLMRAAAIGAGFMDPDTTDAQRLNLVLEPEAAAVYCHLQNERTQFEIKAGHVLMVVDVGDSTLGITTHRITPEGEFDALSEASEGLFGSMYADREFFKWLSGRLGTAAVEALNVSFPKERLRLLVDWEDAKCRFDGVAERANVIAFPHPYYRYLQQHHAEALRKLFETQDGEDYFVRVTSADMHTIFSPVIDGLLRQVRAQFESLKGQQCDYLLLVGSFAENPCLQKFVNETFDVASGGPTRVVIPQHPSRAVLGGSVAYGMKLSGYTLAVRAGSLQVQ